MIASLLIANRGEIACRVIRTARRMGIRTVAVYSDADTNALHVRLADEAVYLGPSPALESYLLGDRIIAAAKETGAEAIHPAYGFLSENAAFAEDVEAAGLTWIGPPPAVIRAMGRKDAAKTLMTKAGVPVTPGYLGEGQSPKHLASEAAAIGYPVLIKAVAGGGGKGMRRVDVAGDFAGALASCRREAKAAFGDDKVLIEKFISRPRHIEVQVFGDMHGSVVHLFERDCSLQRRHQKIVEEAPAPGMGESTRAAICDAAVRAARAVGYVGAGTVEFIADASEGLRADRIWFMEMNTRLQVEHPVTEAITGQDLVEWQLRVAAGEPLPKSQDALSINGWAMEARLYAEDPARGFLPSTGRLDVFRLGKAWRVDSGAEQGDEIPPDYDPMIAKIIAWGESRDAAREGLASALAESAIWPVRTNAGFLVATLRHPVFADGAMDTGFVEREGQALLPPAHPSKQALKEAASRLAAMNGLGGFRLNAARQRQGHFLLNGEPVTVMLHEAPGVPADRTLITEGGQCWELRHWRAEGHAEGPVSDGSLVAPMPGRIIAIAAVTGDRVTKGQALIIMEAMKMEQSLVAPFDGTLAELRVEAGAQVSEGTLLARVEKGDA